MITVKNILPFAILVFFTFTSCALPHKLLAEATTGYACIISDLATDKIIHIEGDCDTQETPCSTFKIALSLMGIDAGILKSDRMPEWPYDASYNAPLEVWRQPHTPQTWMQHSCVWYSRKLTAMLGMEKFKKYVHDFDYGNHDVTGTPGKNDGLTASWLCSSLKISPRQQIVFIRKLLRSQLPVSTYAHQQTEKLLQLEDLAGGWKLYGKAGGGIFDSLDKSLGWLVGWVTKEKQTLVFACLVRSNDPKHQVNGATAKEMALKQLQRTMPHDLYYVPVGL